MRSKSAKLVTFDNDEYSIESYQYGFESKLSVSKETNLIY